MIRLCFATNNANKLAEIRSKVGERFIILSLKDIGCDEELPETQDTIEGNAAQKAQYVFQKYQTPCFADDTGLEINALDGRPRVYSARYAGPDCSPEDNMTKVLTEMKSIDNRSASFKTVIHLCMPDQEKNFTGIVNGSIRKGKSGAKGFGYDPIFEPEGYNITFAEMTMEDKNAISHRGKAVQQLIDFLSSL
ncbi:MAG: non-canonical purine NTP diphosphatase [Cytophagaceae bacterium]